MKIYESIAAIMLASTLMFTLSACEEQGPMEEAGENIDDAIDDTRDAFDDATDGR